MKGRIRKWRLEHVEMMVEGRVPKQAWLLALGAKEEGILRDHAEGGINRSRNILAQSLREGGEEEKEDGDLSQYRISLSINWKIVYRRVYLSCFEFYRNITLRVVIYLWKYRPVTMQHFSPLY
jgi:hypothetical protein